MIFLVSEVFIVSIRNNEFTIFDNPEFLSKLVHEVSIMRNKEKRSFICMKRMLESFASIIIEMIGRLIENKKVI